jgi:2-phospho-L-lactate guanylyltransferase
MKTPIWAVLPIKETALAKQRLSQRLSASARQQLVLAMLADVLDALSQTAELAGILAVTVDPAAAELAQRYGARVWEVGARDGHTGAVTTAARRLAADGYGMMSVPGDIPLLASVNIRDVLAAHADAPSFTIVPARDLQGSNCIVTTPADAVPLRFGEDSFYPHLAAAERAGIKPSIVRCPAIELDVDTPDDLAELESMQGTTRTQALLARWSAGRERADTGATA